MIDPARCNVAVDASGLSRPAGDTIRAGQVDRLLKLHADGMLHSSCLTRVWDELHRAGTPSPKRAAANDMIFTIKTGLTIDEQRRRQVIKTALQGNAKPGKHDADAEHLAEAAKYGGYFVTHDDRILSAALHSQRPGARPASRHPWRTSSGSTTAFAVPSECPDLTVGDLDFEPVRRSCGERRGPKSSLHRCDRNQYRRRRGRSE